MPREILATPLPVLRWCERSGSAKSQNAKARKSLLHFSGYSGVVQLVARQPLELVILVRVQAPEPSSR